MRMHAPFPHFRGLLFEQVENGVIVKIYNFKYELYARQFAAAKSAHIYEIEQVTKGYVNNCKHGIYRGYHFKFSYSSRMWSVYEDSGNSITNHGSKFRSSKDALDYIDILLDITEKGLILIDKIEYDAFQSQNWNDPECPPLDNYWYDSGCSQL